MMLLAKLAWSPYLEPINFRNIGFLFRFIWNSKSWFERETLVIKLLLEDSGIQKVFRERGRRGGGRGRKGERWGSRMGKVEAEQNSVLQHRAGYLLSTLAKTLWWTLTSWDRFQYFHKHNASVYTSQWFTKLMTTEGGALLRLSEVLSSESLKKDHLAVNILARREVGKQKEKRE